MEQIKQTKGHLGKNNKYLTSDLVISMQTAPPKKILILLNLQRYMQALLGEDQDQTRSLDLVFQLFSSRDCSFSFL